MADIRVPSELWKTRMLPEGILEQWTVANGATIEAGEAVAEVSIEGSLHRLLSPAAGRLLTQSRPNEIVEPGKIIGQIIVPQGATTSG